MSQVQEYMQKKDYVTLDRTIEGTNRIYDVLFSPAGMLPLSCDGEFDFNRPVKVDVPLNEDDRILNDIEAKLAKKIAAKFSIEVGKDDGQCFYIHVMDEADADNLYNAVRKYDSIINSEEFDRLRQEQPSDLDEKIKELVN
ncbi:MAG: hypothetical protein V3V78_03725 [Candidatus Woesearchaeota archaeon]